MNKKKCCFCKKDYGEYGHNPAPLSLNPKARCCDLCNWTLVMVARLGNTEQARAMFTEESYHAQQKIVEELREKAGGWMEIKLTNQEGECPLCQSENLDFNGNEIDDLCVNNRWDCKNCGASGIESYDMEFVGHFNVQDKNGKEFEINKQKEEKSNFQMLQEVKTHYKEYKKEIRKGILDQREIELIDNTFKLHTRQLLDIQNLRDFVVAVLPFKLTGVGESLEEFKKDYLDGFDEWDMMSAITTRIDFHKIRLGGEVWNNFSVTNAKEK